MRAAGRVIWCDRGWMPTYFGFCPSERAWRREMKLMGVKDDPPPEYPTSDGKASQFLEGGKNCVLVTISERIDKKRDRLGVVGLIVHEAMHVWQHIRRDIGETEPSPEFEAYALQSISIQLCSAYSKTRWAIG